MNKNGNNLPDEFKQIYCLLLILYTDYILFIFYDTVDSKPNKYS